MVLIITVNGRATGTRIVDSYCLFHRIITVKRLPLPKVCAILLAYLLQEFPRSWTYFKTSKES